MHDILGAPQRLGAHLKAVLDSIGGYKYLKERPLSTHKAGSFLHYEDETGALHDSLATDWKDTADRAVLCEDASGEQVLAATGGDMPHCAALAPSCDDPTHKALANSLCPRTCGKCNK